MARLNVGRTGIVFGTLVAAFHAAWAGLVAIGQAQVVVDFLHAVHFVEPVYQVQPFDPRLAMQLVAVSFVVSSTVAALLALAWNLSNGGRR